MTSTEEVFDPLVSTIKAVMSNAKTYIPSDRCSTGGDNAVYGFAKVNKMSELYKWPCHANMRLAHGDDVKAVWSVFCKPRSDLLTEDATKLYFNWITDRKNSPWRSLFEKQPTIKYGRYNVNNPAFQWRYGFVFDNMKELPANLLMNFFVASRMAKEWPNTIQLWHELVTKHNCDPAVAFFFIRLMYKKSAASSSDEYVELGKNKLWGVNTDERSIGLYRVNYYDWPLDTATCTVEYFQNFCFGTPVNLEQPMTEKKKSPAYHKINNCWGNNALHGTYSPQSYTKFLFTTYNTTGEIVKPTCSLSNYFIQEDHWMLHKREIIQIIHKEEERLKGIYSANAQQAA